MPYKYIGKTHDFKGKTLWEILGNLKNFGVGRIVARNRMERYPEPSYMKILKVETLPQPEDVSLDNLRKIRVLVQKTFRGYTFPKPVLVESSSYKTDYNLIPRSEENDYCKASESKNQERILPRTMAFPPLLKELIGRDVKSDTELSKQDLELEIVYNHSSKHTKYRIAEEGEEPTERITIGLGKPVTPRLYKGIDCETESS